MYLMIGCCQDLLTSVPECFSNALTWTVIQPITATPTLAELMERMGLQESDLESARLDDVFEAPLIPAGHAFDGSTGTTTLSPAQIFRLRDGKKDWHLERTPGQARP
jgi:hypothetical protein